MKNVLLAGAVSSALLISGCSSSSSDVEDVIDDLTVTVSGTVSNINDEALSGVTVEGVYVTPGDSLNPKTTSDASGNYSLSVIKDEVAYLHSSKSGYVTMNTAKNKVTANITRDIGLPTEAEAQSVIDAAYPGTALSSKAWIVAGVVDGSGNDLVSQVITVSGATATAVYPDCDGSNIGAGSTVDCSDPTANRAVAYIASFDANATVTVSVGTDTQTVVVRMGEIADLEFTP